MGYNKTGKITLVPDKEKKFYTLAMFVILVFFTISTIFTSFNPFSILKEYKIFIDFVTKDFMPPDFIRTKDLFSSLLITIQLAIGASFIAALLAFLFSFFGSSTTMKLTWITRFIRSLGSVARNIPALIWSFILVMAFGIGTTVGLLALIIESFGLLLRSYIETIDEVGNESIEALDAVGANFFQKIAQCIIPSAMPGYISWFLYSLEVNIRSSTIVGMVGGGGVGLVLMSYIKSFKYHSASFVILAIALSVIVVELITNWLRRRVLD